MRDAPWIEAAERYGVDYMYSWVYSVRYDDYEDEEEEEDEEPEDEELEEENV